MKSVISKHNKTILRKHDNPSCTLNTKNDLTRPCNCRQATEGPVNGKCLEKSVVYQTIVTIADNQDKHIYFGVTANTFRERFRNRKKSFTNVKYTNETELSKLVWKHKRGKRDYNIKWSRLSNHPDFVGIIQILLENPESRPICRRNRKIPDFDICFK